MLHLDVLDRDAQHVSGDLCERRLGALPVRRDVSDHVDVAGAVDLDARVALPYARLAA